MMKHIKAPLVGFETVPAIEEMLSVTDPHFQRRPARRFPVRYARYWFMRHVLTDLHARLERPLRVLEVGIGRGKMLAFMGGPQIDADRYALPNSIARWDALSAQADPRTLARYSYSSFQQADIEQDFNVTEGAYDAIVVLHVLEHLATPEATMHRLIPALGKDGVLLGGSPTMPGFLASLHERQLRRKYSAKIGDLRAHKHLSVITPGRIRRFAKSEKLKLDLLSGAFFLRSSRSPLEDRAWWLRANLAWGALFPALGGEIYFALRKTRACLAALFAFVSGEFVPEVSS